MNPNPPVRCTAMAHVADVARSIAFYEQLGFEAVQTYAPEGRLCWAFLQSGFAGLMVTLADAPIARDAQGVLFYIYFPDIAAKHAELSEKCMEVGPMSHPLYCPDGEFRLLDPDGYCLMLTHA